jgi:Flp pilus assembly protein TadG
MMTSRSMFTRLRRYGRNTHGAAAAEFAIWLVVLVPAVLNALDVGFYAYDKMQVANAAQAGAQAAYAAWANCLAQTQTSNCSGFSTAVSTAITNSSFIGGSVSKGTTTSTEGYYCADVATGSLASNGTSTTCPSGATAGYYYPLRVTFTYIPMIKGATITNLLNTTMTQDSWIRLA